MDLDLINYLVNVHKLTIKVEPDEGFMIITVTNEENRTVTIHMCAEKLDTGIDALRNTLEVSARKLGCDLTAKWPRTM